MRPFSLAFSISFLLLVLAPSPANPQPNLPPPGGYNLIPNFTGPDAGLAFRDAINDRFSGVQPIVPRVGTVPFANLGPEQDGASLYCSDCQSTLPCTAGGTGA